MPEFRSIGRRTPPGCAIIFVGDDYKLTIEVTTCRPFFLPKGPLMVRLRGKPGLYLAGRCFRIHREEKKEELVYE